MFRNLKKEIKKFQLKEKVKNIFLGKCPIFAFDQKLFITLVSQINFLHKLYFHVCYKRAIKRRIFKTL